jgi:hypothetical protein
MTLRADVVAFTKAPFSLPDFAMKDLPPGEILSGNSRQSRVSARSFPYVSEIPSVLIPTYRSYP